jgi:hypothetical protein
MVCLGRSRGRRVDLSGRRNLLVCYRGRFGRVRRLVLSKNETASAHHMKTKILSILLLSIFSPVGQALACPFCYGAKDGKSTEHMAVAIWFLFGAVMSVLGGIGAFSFHLWRHGRMPAEPYQEITEEDLSKYE